MNIDKIESVDVKQSILGRLLDYGTLLIIGTGDTLEPLSDIAHPVELRKRIRAG